MANSVKHWTTVPTIMSWDSGALSIFWLDVCSLNWDHYVWTDENFKSLLSFKWQVVFYTNFMLWLREFCYLDSYSISFSLDSYSISFFFNLVCFFVHLGMEKQISWGEMIKDKKQFYWAVICIAKIFILTSYMYLCAVKICAWLHFFFSSW